MGDRLAARVAGFGTSVFTEMSRLAVRHRAVNLGQGFPDFPEAEVAKLGDFEEKWINGDCAVPGFGSLDGLFKRLMEHEA